MDHSIFRKLTTCVTERASHRWYTIFPKTTKYITSHKSYAEGRRYINLMRIYVTVLPERSRSNDMFVLSGKKNTSTNN